uniref:Reverse transcriptase domain-containing protein n=1 Tax=Amphimedon queenslandica TaxID=400682 RepID=A0A1X7TK22_AMPQE
MKGSPDVILSKEGVTQGDPLSMFIYAVATVPLIRKLNQISGVTQLWYADDSSAIGGLSQLHVWFDLLIEIGPHYGYFPEPRKSSLIIKSNVSVEDTRGFSDVGVNVVTSCRFLGGIIGSDVGRDEFVSLKSEEWEHYVNFVI